MERVLNDMTLRDYLAAHALGLTEYACDLAYNEHEAGVPCNPAAHAEAAYRIADAMLAERKK